VNAATAVVLALAGAFAIGNWISRVNGSSALEYATKPTVTALLAVAALTLDPYDGATRAWFVVALLLSLAGDVFLMLPQEQFVAGLASFLLAHVAYIVGFLVGGVHAGAAAIGAVLVLFTLGPLAAVIVLAARDREPDLAPAVAVYIVVIATMVVCAIGSTRGFAIAGAALFAASDATIAITRFVRTFAWAPLLIMVTYHLGQTGLVLSLLK
jgi:uncharacterized membrane protein YhhN